MDLFFGDNAAWFTIPALIGTGFFLLRVVLMVVGLGVDVPDLDLDHPDSTSSFHILSLQSISAFAMGFGWGGFAAYRSSPEWGTAGIIGAALVSGGAMVWLLAFLLKAVSDMERSGNIRIGDAIGKEGQVYVTVPAGGDRRGQVKLVIDQRQRIFDAIAAGGDLPTGTRIRVVHVNEDNTLTVDRA